MRISREKISIIVPVYNVEDYLRRCVESIRNQSYKNIQIILVDDGSVDRSLDICNQVALNDPRIEVHHTENRGSVSARKYGMKKAEGVYTCFVDADDYLSCDMVSRLFSILKNSDADFVHFGHIEEKDGEEQEVCFFDETVIDLTNNKDKILFLQKYILNGTNKEFISSSIWSKMFKTDFIKNCIRYLPDEQQYGEDLICLCRCILESRRIVLTKEILYHYTIREASLSHIKYDDFMMKEIGLWYYILKVFEEYQYLEFVKIDVYKFLKGRMLQVVMRDERNKLQIPRFYYKDIKKIIGEKIVIFGAGNVGQDYYAQIRKYRSCEIIAWMDSDWKRFHCDYAEVVGTENLDSIEYDRIIIAVNDDDKAAEMKESLLHIGVPVGKIDWKKPGMYY